MNSTLLETQTRIPPQAGALIPRSRLAKAIEANLIAARLVLVTAPAGYGKTTLLAQWARASHFPVAWLSIHAAENDHERFIRYFYRALEQVHPEVRESEAGILLEGMQPDFQQALPALINFASQLAGHLVLVLDDYHLIENSDIHQVISYLLDQLPETFHLVLSTRAEPPLPLARYRARGQMFELRADELQFEMEETAVLLNGLLGLDLPRQDIERLHAGLEGWASGLRLAGLSLQRRSSATQEPLITGKNRFIADYLRQDVVNSLPDAQREFLLHTSILDRLCASLCNAVTGQQDSQWKLETLERENLFLFALDDTREWYRYHHLFAEFLREELAGQSPGIILELHRRAARWFLQHDLPEDAYQHALAARDLPQMAELFNRYANAKLYAGEFHDLKRWLDGLPVEWYAQYPALGLARAGYLAYTGSVDACLIIVDEVELSLTPPRGADERYQLARVKAVRCFLACMENNMPLAESLADQALRELPPKDEDFLPNIYAALGDTYRQNGLWQKAYDCYLKALDYAHAPAMQVITANIYGAIADLNLQQGHLHSAADYWERALLATQKQENWGRYPLPLAGWIYIRSAELRYEWNQLDSAAENLSQGLERARLGGDVRAQIAGTLLQARLGLAQGQVEAAGEAISRVQLLVEKAHFPEWTARFERCRVDVWVAGNQLQPALQWCQAALQPGEIIDPQEGDIRQLAVARVLIASGERPSLEQALVLLGSVLAAAESSGRRRTTIEGLALQALAKWQLSDPAGAMIDLERALRMAEPESYLRLFADLGLPMGRLLQEARSRKMMTSYVDRLLEVFGKDLPPASSTGPFLPEPLTPREQEVLQLVAAGLSNREIAEKFVISSETVKKHVSSIAGKLGAGNRTEAVARARALGLLDS